VPRPRQTAIDDCVVAVFREIASLDEDTARERFGQYKIAGQPGYSSIALSSCLTSAGWMLQKDECLAERYRALDGTVDRVAFKTVWSGFRDIAVVGYTKGDTDIGHMVVVRSGGIVFDPAPPAPEDGEFIWDHFKRLGNNFLITEISTVEQLL